MWLDDVEEKVFETINGVPNGKVIAWRPLPEPYRQRAEHERLMEIGEALLEGISDSEREMEEILNEEN